MANITKSKFISNGTVFTVPSDALRNAATWDRQSTDNYGWTTLTGTKYINMIAGKIGFFEIQNSDGSIRTAVPMGYDPDTGTSISIEFTHDGSLFKSSYGYVPFGGTDDNRRELVLEVNQIGGPIKDFVLQFGGWFDASVVERNHDGMQTLSNGVNTYYFYRTLGESTGYYYAFSLRTQVATESNPATITKSSNDILGGTNFYVKSVALQQGFTLYLYTGSSHGTFTSLTTYTKLDAVSAPEYVFETINGTADLNASSSISAVADVTDKSVLGEAFLLAQSSVSTDVIKVKYASAHSMDGEAALASVGTVKDTRVFGESNLTGKARIQADVSVIDVRVYGEANLVSFSSISAELTNVVIDVLGEANLNAVGTSTIQGVIVKRSTSSVQSLASVSASAVTIKNGILSITGKAIINFRGFVVSDNGATLPASATMNANSIAIRRVNVPLSGKSTMGVAGIVVKRAQTTLASKGTTKVLPNIIKYVSVNMGTLSSISANGRMTKYGRVPMFNSAFLVPKLIPLLRSNADIIVSGDLDASGYMMKVASISITPSAIAVLDGVTVTHIEQAIAKLTGTSSMLANASPLEYTLEAKVYARDVAVYTESRELELSDEIRDLDTLEEIVG